MRFFSNVPKINFMAQRRTGLMVSSALTAITILLLVFRGLNFGIDFTGGVLVEVGYPQTVELDSVRESLGKAGYERAVVQYFGTTHDVLIRLPPAAEGANSSKVSTAILDAAALGFLGLGAQPPAAEWGTMLADAREFVLRAWWVVTFPGLAILTVSLAFNLLGDGLRDVLDPRSES